MVTAGGGGEDVPESWEEVADQSPEREGRKRPLNRESSSSSSNSGASQTSLEDIDNGLVEKWDDLGRLQRRVARNKERETRMEKDEEKRDAKRQRRAKNPPTQASQQPGSLQDRQNLINLSAANTMRKSRVRPGGAVNTGIMAAMANEKLQAARVKGMEFGRPL